MGVGWGVGMGRLSLQRISFSAPRPQGRKLEQVGGAEFPMLSTGALILECVFYSRRPRPIQSARTLLLFLISLLVVHCDCAPPERFPREEQRSQGCDSLIGDCFVFPGFVFFLFEGRYSSPLNKCVFFFTIHVVTSG